MTSLRPTTIVLTTLVAVLALSVGALAYPAVVNGHILPSFGSSTTTPKVGHPTAGDDNGTTNETENETAPPASPPPEANETEVNETENDTAPAPPAANETDNETGNASEMTNVTFGNTTIWINGTIQVTVANETVVNMTFEVRAVEGQGANVTFGGSFLDNGTTVSVSGVALLVPDERLAYVHATYTLTRDGVTLDSRDLVFQLSWPEVSTASALATPMAGMSFALTLTPC